MCEKNEMVIHTCKEAEFKAPWSVSITKCRTRILYSFTIIPSFRSLLQVTRMLVQQSRWLQKKLSSSLLGRRDRRRGEDERGPWTTYRLLDMHGSPSEIWWSWIWYDLAVHGRCLCDYYKWKWCLFQGCWSRLAWWAANKIQICCFGG